MSNELNKAIITISNNPFLKDDSYKVCFLYYKEINRDQQKDFTSEIKQVQKFREKIIKGLVVAGKIKKSSYQKI